MQITPFKGIICITYHRIKNKFHPSFRQSSLFARSYLKLFAPSLFPIYGIKAQVTLAKPPFPTILLMPGSKGILPLSSYNGTANGETQDGTTNFQIHSGDTDPQRPIRKNKYNKKSLPWEFCDFMNTTLNE